MKNKFVLFICMTFILLMDVIAQNNTKVSHEASLKSDFDNMSAFELFQKAIVWWNFSDLNDKAGTDSQLKADRNVNSDMVQNWECKASKDHRGDGYVVDLKGIHLNAGQGFEGELNLCGPFQNI